MVQFEGEDLAVCVACGTQYDTDLRQHPASCRICEDPRQFIPTAGQQWTSLREEQGKHQNAWKQDAKDERIWHLYADPKLGIGERASLIKTPHGNIIFDLFAYLSPELIGFITSQGPLHAIVISHPHFYTTHLTWSSALSVPVYTHAADAQWLSRPDPSSKRRLITGETQEILPGVTAIRVGGHFPGSMALHFDGHLFVADAMMLTPAGLGARPTPEGQNWFAFMWSIPLMVPLSPDEIFGIWEAVKGWEIRAVHGLMMGMDVYSEYVKAEALKAMQGQVRRMGWKEHRILEEKLGG